MTTHTAAVRNIQLAQGYRPVRRQTTNNSLEFEAKRADRIQRRHEAEQIRHNRNLIAIAAIIAVALIATSGWLAEHLLWILAMAFSAC